MNNIDKTLTERGDRYGSFMCHAELSQKLQNALFKHKVQDYTPSQKEALTMICHKLARIANGDPNYDDSWRDICGYATLIVKELNGESM